MITRQIVIEIPENISVANLAYCLIIHRHSSRRSPLKDFLPIACRVCTSRIGSPGSSAPPHSRWQARPYHFNLTQNSQAVIDYREQCVERGANEEEVTQAILNGSREAANRDRILCRYNFSFGQSWNGKKYQIKQVAPVIKESATETIVITVYTFFF